MTCRERGDVPSGFRRFDREIRRLLGVAFSRTGPWLRQNLLALFIADLRHYDGIESAENMPRPALLMAEFTRRIVRAGTARDAGVVHETALRCRRRPQHKACAGRLVVRRGEVPAEIDWHCPVCSDAGLIHGWAGSPCDLSRDVGPTEGRAVRAVVPDSAYQIALTEFILDPDSDRLLYSTRMVRDGVEIAGNEYDMENLMEFMAAAANHSSSWRRQRELDTVSD